MNVLVNLSIVIIRLNDYRKSLTEDVVLKTRICVFRNIVLLAGL